MSQFHKHDEVLVLSSMSGGAVQEKFEDELSKVMENIHDVNTSEAVARKITLEFTFRPNKSRNGSTLSISAKSKLAPAEVYETQLFHGRDSRGDIKVGEHDMRQMGFGDMPQEEQSPASSTGRITQIK